MGKRGGAASQALRRHPEEGPSSSPDTGGGLDLVRRHISRLKVDAFSSSSDFSFLLVFLWSVYNPFWLFVVDYVGVFFQREERSYLMCSCEVFAHFGLGVSPLVIV